MSEELREGLRESLGEELERELEGGLEQEPEHGEQEALAFSTTQVHFSPG